VGFCQITSPLDCLQFQKIHQTECAVFAADAGLFVAAEGHVPIGAGAVDINAAGAQFARNTSGPLRAAGDKPGTVGKAPFETIRAPISEAALIIEPALADFQRQHPELRIPLLSAIWADTVLESGIDIEIRLGTGSWPGAHAEPLGTEVVVPIGAPELAAAIDSPRQFLDHPRIHILRFDDHWPRFFETIGLPAEAHPPGITAGTSLAAVELAAAGGGTALLLGRIASRLTGNGRLASPLELETASMQTHFLLTRDTAAAPKTATGMVEAWLRELFA
jgi:LysR family glycine cleavage system transcriptional activator